MGRSRLVKCANMPLLPFFYTTLDGWTRERTYWNNKKADEWVLAADEWEDAHNEKRKGRSDCLVPELRVIFLLSLYWTCRISVYFFSRATNVSVGSPDAAGLLVYFIDREEPNPKWEDEREGIQKLYPALVLAKNPTLSRRQLWRWGIYLFCVSSFLIFGIWSTSS